jgi:hypothetical protein
MNEADFPRLRPWWHPLSIAGAIFRGGYPQDKKMRQAALVGTICVTLLGIVGQVVRSGDARTDRMLAEQRADLREALGEIKHLAQKVEHLGDGVHDLAAAAERTRTTLLEKIPDAPPRPQRVRSRPVEPSR